MPQSEPVSSPPVLLVSGEGLSRYGFGDAHPFGLDRQEAFLRELRRSAVYPELRQVEPRIAERAELETFHRPEFVDLVQQKSAEGRGYLDAGDTPATRGIFEAASFVVGGTLLAVEEIMDGRARRGFIPIGGLHHASRTHAAGFCVFNDCGVAIEQLRRRHGVRRVAYVDIDAHHGDGVFYAFESDPDVLFADIHEDGRHLYPGTGTSTRPARARRPGPSSTCRCRRARATTNSTRQWRASRPTCDAPSPSSSCSSAAPTASKATRSRTWPSARKRTPMRRRRCAASPTRLGHGRVLAMGGGGYNRQNLARAWTRVVESLVASQ